MSGIIGIATLLAIVAIGLLITRIATVALVFTGVSRDLARFQARSAFVTCGFTTTESEQVINHPVRRRIIMLLMLLGNGSLVMAISSIIPIFMEAGDSGGLSIWMKLFLLMTGLAILWFIAISSTVDRYLSALISWTLKRFTNLEIRDYHALFNLGRGYSVTELRINAGDWVAGRSLAQMRLSDEGVQVLAISRSGEDFMATPTGMTVIQPGDTLLLYGKTEQIAELEGRRSGSTGDQLHEQRIREQQQAIKQQERMERARQESGAAGEHDRAVHALLQLSQGYTINEMKVFAGDWAAGKNLSTMRLVTRGCRFWASGEWTAPI